jgi:two-component system, sporulation sensor kinase D
MLLNRRSWPAALALLAVVTFGSYLVYTEALVREIRAEAALHTRMYALVQQGLLSIEPGAELKSLMALQRRLTELGVPIVVVDARGELYAAENLPFEVDLSDPGGHRRVLDYAARLARQQAPIVEPGVGTIYFGAPPIVGWLRWLPWLQFGGGVLLLLVAWGLIRANLRAEAERTWAAMARQLAHQMGTPLSSLVGWTEVLRLPAEERAELVAPDRIADEIAADVERLERVARRFEMIGKPPALEAVSVASVVEELERYLRPRVPRLAAGVRFAVRVEPGLPLLRANQVLLVWALENLVRNALDALAGRGGRIRVIASAGDEGWVRLYVSDTGPGIPAGLRHAIFEPGVTTKAGGWGVGLSLTRRIIEDMHGGRIQVRGRRGGGTVFEIHLPTAGERRRRRRVLKES